jgi:hypothetical protein
MIFTENIQELLEKFISGSIIGEKLDQEKHAINQVVLKSAAPPRPLKFNLMRTRLP